MVLNRSGQLGILLEVFILILMLVIFYMFWNSFSRTTFLAGLFKISDSEMKHSCFNMIPIIIGTDYIKGSSGVTNDYATQALIDYLGFEGEVVSVPDAKFFYDKIKSEFKGLERRVYVIVITGDGTRTEAGVKAPLLTGTTCEFPLYSIDEELAARLILQVYI